MNLAAAMAARYLWDGRNRYARFISWISLIGLALGVLVLTVVVSVMNGLGQELRTRILGTVPHVLVSPPEPGLTESLVAQEQVQSAFAFFSSSGMVTGNGVVVPVSLHGIDAGDAPLLRQVDGNMLDGPLAAALDPPGGIVMGMPMARHLGLGIGDTVMLVVSEPAGGSVRPRLMRFRLSGTFQIGAETDHYLVLVRRDSFTQRQRQYLGVDGVRVVLNDPMQVDAFAARVRALHPSLSVETWQEAYGELFQAVRIEKALMFLLLLLVVAVAGFNIVSGQTVLVADKRSDIAILRTMGADARFLNRVFLWQGVAVASLGIAIGLASGVLLAQNIDRVMAAVESLSGFHLLEGSYFTVLPSIVLAQDLLVIGVLSWLLCVLAAWIPARRAARQNPVAGLHV